MKKFSFLSFCLVVVGILTCASCGYMFSNIILTAGLFSNPSTITSTQQNVFAISMQSSKQLDELQTYNESLQAQNAAGYIFEKDENFHILASVYANKADAELVKNNLSTQGVSCTVEEISLPTTKIDGNFPNDEKNILNKCLNTNFSLFEKLFDIAISLDTNVLDKTKAKLECNNVYSFFISTKTNFETMLKEGSLKNIENNLKAIEESLKKLINEEYESSGQTFSSLIKLTYCKILLDTCK